MVFRLALLVALAPLVVVAPLRAQTAATTRWYKGNTHTHTLNSDGDSTPDEVVRWYREHGYAFVVLTDHNYLTSVDGLNALHGADERFVVIRGEEISESFAGKPLHVNAFDPASTIAPQGGNSVLDVLNRTVGAIRRANGIPSINHPNYGWAISREELQQVRDNKLFEVYNGHPQVNNLGGGGVPGLEDVWDTILSNGVLLYGIAVDDAHFFKDPGNPDIAAPGRGWIMVRAPRLDPRTLIEAIERGEFYATTGVELQELEVSARRIRVSVNVKSRPSSKYRIQFVGKGGRVLAESFEASATYDITGTEGYVRTRVAESNGRMAWIQPAMVTARPATPASSMAWMAGATAAVGLLGLWRYKAP